MISEFEEMTSVVNRIVANGKGDSDSDVPPIVPECDNQSGQVNDVSAVQVSDDNRTQIIDMLSQEIVPPEVVDKTPDTGSSDETESNSKEENVPLPTDLKETSASESNAENTINNNDNSNETSQIISELNKLTAKIDGMEQSLSIVKSKLEPLAGYHTLVNQITPTLELLRRSEENAFKEAEQYKKDFLYTIIKPFLDSFVEMSIEITKSRVDYENDKEEILQSNSESFYDEVINLHDYLQKSIDGMLNAHGVIKKKFQEGSEYIPAEQKITKAILTEETEKEGTVAEVLSDAYIYTVGNKVLRQANVYVYKLKK